MKKQISLFLAILFLLSCLSGCGDSSSEKAGLDFFASIYNVAFQGYDGDCEAVVYTRIDLIDYDKENSDITAFLKDVKLDYQRYNLHNGDALTVTLSYSKSKAEELGITFRETSKSFTVHGLLEKNTPPATAEKIDTSALSAALQKQLPSGHRVESAYYDYDNFFNLYAWTSAHEERGELFPEGYTYLYDLYTTGNGNGPTAYYLRAVSFLVSCDKGYYYCEAGVNPDGTLLGDFTIYSHIYESKDDALSRLQGCFHKTESAS